ncbi:MAG: ATP-grasp domain-containing protein [Polyangiales bacterium]|nr:ATP-grasp domain-containing protein [Myxococcales bacterium]
MAPPARTGRERPRLLMVGGGIFQADMVRTAKRVGAEVWTVDRNPDAPAMHLSDHALPIDFGDVSAVLALEHIGFDGVTTAASDAAIPTVVACAHAWGLRAVSPDALRLCQDKLRTMDALVEAGLPAASTRFISHDASVKPHIDAVCGYPFVIKPRFGAGGRGVSVVRTPEEVEPAVAKVLRHTPPEQGFLVQEFLRGQSVGVEAFLADGRIVRGVCLGDEYKSHFVSPIGHSLPAGLAPEIERDILAQVERIAGVLGVTDGPMNFDLRYDHGEVWLIEANARLGGNSITELVRVATGVDLGEVVVRAALGQSPEAALAPKHDVRPAAARLFVVRGHGMLEHLDGMRAWSEDPNVLAFELASAGAPLTARVDEWAIVGRCLVRGASAQAAVALAESIAADVEAHIRASA